MISTSSMSVIKLGQLPVTEFKVASQPTTVSGFFLLSLDFHYCIFLEKRSRDIILGRGQEA